MNNAVSLTLEIGLSGAHEPTDRSIRSSGSRRAGGPAARRPTERGWFISSNDALIGMLNGMRSVMNESVFACLSQRRERLAT